MTAIPFISCGTGTWSKCVLTTTSAANKQMQTLCDKINKSIYDTGTGGAAERTIIFPLTWNPPRLNLSLL